MWKFKHIYTEIKYFAEFCVLRFYSFGEKKERKNVVGKQVWKNY